MSTRGAVTAADGARLATRAWGPARGARGTVVLTHGYMLDSRCWEPVVPWVVAAGWRALAWDLRGHGGSRGLAPHTLAQAADDLRSVIGTVRGPMALVGHSVGGMVSQAVLAEDPARVAALGLLATTAGGTGFAPLTGRWWLGWAYRRPERAGRLWRAVGPVSPRRYARTSADAVAAYLPHIQAFAAPEVRYPGPTLVVVAGWDELIPGAAAGRFAELYPDAEVLRLPRVRHDVMRFAPRPVGRALARLLREAERSGGTGAAS